jgi:hypothetical protein
MFQKHLSAQLLEQQSLSDWLHNPLSLIPSSFSSPLTGWVSGTFLSLLLSDGRVQSSDVRDARKERNGATG